MGNIDDTLKDILGGHIRTGEIEEIKQAFIDNGWLGPMSDEDRMSLIASYAAAEYMKADLMSGQEWFNRFDKELSRYEGHYHKWMGPLPDEVIEAAKKAAGVSNV